MSTITSLPVILVSAKSEAAAVRFISELIDKEPPDASGAGDVGRVWRIENKYYTADVRLVAHADGGPAPAAVHGHVIYLAEDETDDRESARACARREAAGAAADVRVLACDAARLSPVLLALAARGRLEPVALRAGARREPAADPAGLPAARAALQAHAWPGLRPRRPEPPAAGCGAGRLAAALGAVPAVRALPPGSAERRAAAEALLRTFCAALGQDLHSL